MGKPLLNLTVSTEGSYWDIAFLGRGDNLLDRQFDGGMILSQITILRQNDQASYVPMLALNAIWL